MEGLPAGGGGGEIVETLFESIEAGEEVLKAELDGVGTGEGAGMVREQGMDGGTGKVGDGWGAELVADAVDFLILLLGEADGDHSGFRVIGGHGVTEIG
jgi:hypothetical protein